MGEVQVKLGINAYDRVVSGEPQIQLKNRYLEKSGVNQIEQRIVLARPGTTKEDIYGDGPIRATWHQPGAFGDGLLVVSGNTLYRKYTDGTKRAISGEIAGGSGDVSMAAVSDASRRRVFIADGTLLQYYDGGTNATGTFTATVPEFPDIYFQTIKIGSLHYAWGSADKKARATLTPSANFTATETVTIGDVTYTFTASPVAANDVDVGADLATSLANLVAAITAGTGEGTAYGTGTVANPDATAETDGTTLTATAAYAGLAGNYVETAETCANAAWDGDFLTGAGDINKVAASVVNLAANPSAGDTISINTADFQFNTTIASIDTAKRVLIGATLADTLNNLVACMNGGPGRGVVYSSNATVNPYVTGSVVNGHRVLVVAKDTDTDGNDVTTTSAQANAVWSAAKLFGAQDGTADNPLLALLGDTDPGSLANMVKLINFTGAAGTDFSIAVTAADPNVSATSTETTLTVTSLVDGGTSIATTITPDPDTFLAWGAATLEVPTGETKGKGVLTLTPSETVEATVIDVGGVYYGWGDITTADQDGTSGHPFLAPVGDSIGESLDNMARLINFDGVQTVDFSASVGGANTLATASVALNEDTEEFGNVLTITARSEETDGNSIVISVFAGTILTASGATLTGGGVHTLHGVEVPGGESPIAVASCSGFLLLALDNSQRFYWITPGETTIDALNFASAEFAPDNLLDIRAVADQVWLIGGSSIEVWYPTGGTDTTTAFQPVAGRAFNNGAVSGTVVVIRDTVVFVGTDNVVYSTGGNHMYYTQGGTMQRISTHAIEERIRTQLASEA